MNNRSDMQPNRNERVADAYAEESSDGKDRYAAWAKTMGHRPPPIYFA